MADLDQPQVSVSRRATASRRGTGRGPLSRSEILHAAIELIDDEGLRALTMRKLGARLGVEAMALYHHVPSRDQLLDGIVEKVIDDLYDDPMVHGDAPDGWQPYLQRLAHGVRRIALTHPEVFPLIATRPPSAPWIKPPLRSLRWMESFLSTLASCGFSDSDAATAYRSFSSFLLGHMLLEVSALGVDTGPIEEADPDSTPRTDLSAYPTVERLERELSQDHAAVEFEVALESLILRLEDVLKT